MLIKRTYALLVLLFVIYELGADRTVELIENPDCGKDDDCNKPNEHGSYNNLIYVKATSQNDTVHALYSTISSFSIMLFKTSTTNKLSVNWTNLLSKNESLIRDSISFSEKPYESCGYVFPTIYEFNDTNFDADMSKLPANESLWLIRNTKDLIWKQFYNNSDQSGTFEANQPGTNGSFKFVFRYTGKDQRDKYLPHLLSTQDSGSVDFIIDSVPSAFNYSKFGINVVFLSDNTQINQESLRTLDDEYTPGTFRIYNIKIADETTKQTDNFFQWKPIFYYYNDKTLENSTLTKQYDIKGGQSIPESIGLAFFDSNKFMSGVNVSFGIEGTAKDGYFYPSTKYSSWTFSVGLGEPPKDKISFIVSLVIFVGFGVPALVIVIGLLVMVVRKIRNSRHSDFEQLQ